MKKAKLKVCSLPDCNRPIYARLWCTLHYNRWHRYGDASYQPPPRPYRKREILTRSGATYRQIDYWTRMGWLSQELPGQGYSRTYSDEDIDKAYWLAQASKLILPDVATLLKASQLKQEVA